MISRRAIATLFASGFASAFGLVPLAQAFGIFSVPTPAPSPGCDVIRNLQQAKTRQISFNNVEPGYLIRSVDYVLDVVPRGSFIVQQCVAVVVFADGRTERVTDHRRLLQIHQDAMVHLSTAPPFAPPVRVPVRA